MKTRTVNVAIPARNEEHTLPRSLAALAEHIQKEGIEAHTFICLNACTDNTRGAAQEAQEKYPHLRIKILESAPGMVVAQSEIISEIHDSHPILVIDADTIILEKALSIILDELETHPKLKVVGGHPTPEEDPHAGFFQKHLTRILNARAFYPMSSVYKNPLPEGYHPYVSEGQPTVSAEFEKRSKTFFHGRFFCLRDKSVWTITDPANTISEDLFLHHDLVDRLGPGVIRVRYDAQCLYKPIHSLRHHWKVYYRTFIDFKNHFRRYPRFRRFRKISSPNMKLDWSHIVRNLPLKWIIYFATYFLWSKLERMTFVMAYWFDHPSAQETIQKRWGTDPRKRDRNISPPDGLI